MKKRQIEQSLDDLPKEPAETEAVLRRALGDRSASIVVKAVRRLLELEVPGLTPELIAAFAYFMKDPVKRDPGCRAKTWALRALQQQRHLDHEVYLTALTHRQLEPIYGGSEDTAVELRGLAALGLVETGWAYAAEHVVELLADRDAPARVSAVRALSRLGEALVLRLKALQGDPEPQVTGECLEGLLAIEQARAVDFVARFLRRSDEAVGEVAALALGASRLKEAYAPLREAWDRRVDRRTVLVALATLRHADADRFLRQLVEQRSDGVEVLEPFGFLATARKGEAL